MRYRDKRVLVIGGTGFVGSRLAEKLFLEEGAQVRILVRNWAKAVWVSRYPVELVQGDITDKASISGAFDGCDIVFHCASGESSAGGYRGVNVNGTQNILECAVESNVSRVVYMSSIAVHGANLSDGADETASTRLTGRDYSDSKIMAEKLVREIGEKSRLEISILRPTFVWGPRSALFTMRQIREMRHGTFTLINHGGGSCNAVYVDNLVEATLLAGINPEAVGEAFIITDDETMTWGDFFGNYARILGIGQLPSINSDLLVVRAATHLRDFLDKALAYLAPNPAPFWRKVVRRCCFIGRNWLLKHHICNSWDLVKYSRTGTLNISKAKMILGYRPLCSTAEGMKQTEGWIRDQMGTELGLSDD